jgi:5-methylcytosine-specific restriction endonuclease McrA
MAEKGEKRDPKSHRTPTQIRRQVNGYNAEPENVKKRAMNNAARKQLMKEGKVRKGDNMDVDHKRPLRDGGGNSRSNLRVMHESKNRAWRAKP